jgi:cell shape-determining protein MreD
MLLELINLTKLRKAFIYAGIVLLVLLVQNLILSSIRVFGISPMIVPIIVVAVGFFESGVWGGVFGIIIGLVCDMTFNEATVMFTVLFPIIGFIAGALAMFFMSRTITPFFFVSAAALLITTICQMFRIAVFSDTNIIFVLIGGALQIILSLPFIYAVFYPCRKVSRLDLSK